MKKIFFTLLSVLAVTLSAQADNLVVNSVTIQQWGKATVEVGLNNPDRTYTAFQMQLLLPEGVTGVLNENGRLDIQKSARFDDHSLSSNAISGGYQFVCFSITNAPLGGNYGTLFSFDIQTDASQPVGAVLAGKFTAIAFTTTGQAVELELDDVNFDITVAGVNDFLNLVDGEPYQIDNDVQVNELTYTREFKNTNWQALYIPFEVNVEDIANDFEVAYINAVHQYDDDGDGKVDRTTLEWFYQREGVIQANDPTYLIRAKTTGVKTIKASNVTLKAADTSEFTMSNRSTFFTFYGTYEGITGEEVPDFWAYSGGTVKKAASVTAKLGSYRWYLLITGRGARKMKLESVFVDAEATGVEDVSGYKIQVSGDAPLFNLAGQRIDASHLQKGIYIINGKKMIKK